MIQDWENHLWGHDEGDPKPPNQVPPPLVDVIGDHEETDFNEAEDPDSEDDADEGDD